MHKGTKPSKTGDLNNHLIKDVLIILKTRKYLKEVKLMLKFLNQTL